MTALIKSFSCQTGILQDSLGGKGISKAFSVQMQRLTNSLGGNKISGAFALAHGGYAIDGVNLPDERDKSKIIRQK